MPLEFIKGKGKQREKGEGNEQRFYSLDRNYEILTWVFSGESEDLRVLVGSM